MYRFIRKPSKFKYNRIFIKKIFSGYERLLYCESNGNQYINTGVSWDNTVIIDGHFQQLNSDGFQGYASSSSRPTFFWTTYNFCANNWKYYSLGDFDTEIHHIYLANNLQKRDEETKQTISLANSYYYNDYYATNTFKIYLYAGSMEWIHDNPNWYMTQRIYDLKIYKNGVLIRDYIPVKQLSTNKIGLYDKVNNQFYSSNTGTNFIGGNNLW